jgi:ABC-type amino acid transport system permease subunit
MNHRLAMFVLWIVGMLAGFAFAMASVSSHLICTLPGQSYVHIFDGKCP